MAGAGGIRAGAAYVEVFLKDNQLTRGLKAAEAKLKDFGQGVANIGGKIADLGRQITAPILDAAKTFADAGSALALMSARTGVSVEALSALGYAADQTGTDLDSVETGLKLMSKALVKGSLENMLAAASFQALGLSADDLIRMKPEQAFAAIAKSISAIPNPTARASAALQIFGRSGTKLLPLMKNLQGLTAEAEEFGLVMSGEAAKDALKFGQSMKLVAASVAKLVQTIGSAVAGSWVEWNRAVARNIKAAMDWVSANKPLVLIAFQVGAALVIAGTAIAALGAAIVGTGAVLGGIATIIGTIGTVLGALLSPLGLVAVGLTAGAAAFFLYTDAGKAAVTSLGAAFNDLKADALVAFQGISDALKAGDIALAGEILWAALKVEWLKGVAALDAVWADWGVATVEVFRDVSFRIARVMTEISANIQKGFAYAATFVQDVWAGLMLTLTVGFNGFIAMFKAEWAALKALLTGGDIGAAVQQVYDDLKAKNAEAAGKAGEDYAARHQERDKTLSGIDENTAAAQESITEQQQSQEEGRRKAADDAAKAAADAVEAAKGRLGGLVDKAAKEAASIKKAPEPEAPEGLEDLGDTLDKSKAKVDVAGSFSAAAFKGLGAGTSVQDEQLKEQKKTNDKLDKQNKLSEEISSKFAFS